MKAEAWTPYRIVRNIGGMALATGLLAACSGAPEPAAGAGAVAYQGARVIVGDGSTIDDATILVEDGAIVQVGPTAAVSLPAGATRVDLGGKTVMPTLVDAHVHLRTAREELVEDLRNRAFFGVGAALTMGSDTGDDPLLIRDEGVPGAARLRSAGAGITRPEPGRRQVHWVDTEEQARQAVRDEVARKVDLIKIWVDDRGGQFEKLTPELYGAVIDEAHAHGLRVAAHIVTLEDAKGLLRAGIDIFAHGVRDRDVDDEFLALVAEHPGVVLIPNLPPRGVPTDLTWLAGALPAEELASLEERQTDAEAAEPFGIQARNLDRLDEAGMTIAFGTDGNTAWAPHVEMEDMVAAGMSPADVVVAATRNAAAVLGIEEIGTIAVGKSADFVVLEANPLDDITNTRKIAGVYLRGEPVDRRPGVAGRPQSR